MAEPGDPHSPQDGAQQGPEDADLFRDETPPAPPPTMTQRPTWAAPIRPAPEPSPAEDPHAHDDLIGFTSPASLAGAERRTPEPVAVVEPETGPEDFAPEPIVAPIAGPDPVMAPVFTTPKADPQPVQSPPEASPEPAPAWSRQIPASPTRTDTPFGRSDTGRTGRSGGSNAPEGAVGLYTIYALILFAVPTFGVAAVVGLVMVWMRPRPEQSLARSHFEFQTRTLWIAAITAVIGAVLIAVNLGVFVLVAMAVWVIVRGAWGVMTLAAGKPVSNPRTWMI